MTYDQWQTAVLPKVQGTWNLHEALESQTEPLDFFFLFGSVSGLGGQIGQANYAAGNTFLDAFVQYRQSLGLPASVLDIGIMEDVGFLTREARKLEALRATSLHLLHEKDLLDSLQLILDRSQPKRQQVKGRGYVSHSQVAIGVRSTLPLSAPGNRTSWKKDPRTLVYRNIEFQDSTSGPATNENLKDFLQGATLNPAILTTDEAADFLAQEIGTTLFAFMMKSDEEVDLSASLSSLGVDSLVSIELRNWFRQKVGAVFNVVEIVGAESISHLGRLTASKLIEKHKTRV